MMILTAKDVFKNYFKLLSYTSSIEDWDEQKLSDNPPRYYRLRQLNILFEAYSLGNIADFKSGDFIRKRPLEEYKDLPDMANHFDKEILKMTDSYDYYQEEGLDYWMVEKLFTTLIGYRKIISNANKYTSGVIECGSLFKYAYDLIGHFNYLISKELDIIDDVVSFIISPSGKTYSVNELISKYGFPDVNLKNIDIEWI